MAAIAEGKMRPGKELDSWAGIMGLWNIYIYIGLIFGGSNLSRFNKRCSIGKVQLSLDDNHDMFFVVFCI